MKRLARTVYHGVGRLYFRLRFHWLVSGLHAHTQLYLVDIDNTLAHSWPSLREGCHSRENERYRSLPVFIGMRRFLLEKIGQRAEVIFISARSFLNYNATRDWLRGNGLPGNKVILVARPEDKLKYILELLHREMEVIYIDDLSYGHEHGTVCLYDQLILSVKELPLSYLGINEISVINSNEAAGNKSAETLIPYL